MAATIGVVLVLLAYAITNYTGQVPPQPLKMSIADAEADAPNIDVEVASKELTPSDVVNMQIKSLQDSLTDPSQLRVCYSLASPENRERTGPFSRFATMVMQPPYDQLAKNTNWKIENVESDQDHASVLVTNSQDPSRAFHFLLRRHGKPPYENCWLTDVVEVLQPLTDGR